MLVHARTHGSAKIRAKRIVTRQEIPYKNASGNMVYWRVAQVYESIELFDDDFANGRVKDGAEVYWRYIRTSNPGKRLKREGYHEHAVLR